MTERKLSARTDVLGLVLAGRAIQMSCDQDRRNEMLHLFRVTLGRDGVTSEDQLIEAIWALVNHEDLR